MIPLIAFLMLQSVHSVDLKWSDDLNPAGTTYSIYRAPGQCSGTPPFAKIASGITDKTYTDTSVQPGNYCYAATATSNGMESAMSNTAAAAVPAFPPTGLMLGGVK